MGLDIHTAHGNQKIESRDQRGRLLYGGVQLLHLSASFGLLLEVLFHLSHFGKDDHPQGVVVFGTEGVRLELLQHRCRVFECSSEVGDFEFLDRVRCTFFMK